MQSESEKALRKYAAWRTALGIGILSPWILLGICPFTKAIHLVILFPILLLIATIALRWISKKTLRSVLLDQLDSIEFQKIANKGLFSANLSFRAGAAIAAGDYQTVVDIANTMLANKKCCGKARYYYLSMLARTYFELRDFEKLELLLKKHNDISAKKLPTKQNLVWDYYHHFLNGDYNACLEMCKRKSGSLKSQFSATKYHVCISTFYYAVACYSASNLTEAKSIFEKIVSSAPKLHLSVISQKYIDAIDNNAKISTIEYILPTENYQPYNEKTVKKLKRHRVILIISVILLCISVVLLAVVEYMKYKEEMQRQEEYNAAVMEYENKLNNAIQQHYEQAEFIKYFDIKANGQYIDALCVINTNNGWDLASIVTYDKGETSDIIILIKNISLDQSYCIKSAVSENYIGFQVCTAKPQATNLLYLVDFKYNNTDFWIVIDYIGDAKIN